ncbi:VanZ family protein [Paenibacillus sp. TRM 82003]|nr:VanZ family protein [Paenibacillus sp. TRM 82003]
MIACFILWGSFIFTLSSQPYQEQTLIPYMREYMSEQALRAWMPNITIDYSIHHFNAKQRPFSFLEFAFRKAAHMFVYGVLAAIAYYIVPPYRGATVWKALMTLLVIVCIALLDEWNQLSAIKRTGSIYDVGIDLIGASMGLVIVFMLTKREKGRKSGG